jgi:putative tryptophan/tyrosine transport system substrate-binding protein
LGRGAGRNLTGLALAPEPPGLRLIEAKRPAFLREVRPNAKRLAWVGPAPSGQQTVLGGRFHPTPQMEADAIAQGLETRFFPWLVRQDVDAIFDAVVAWRAQAVTAGFGWAYIERERVGELVLQHRLPGAFLFREQVESGGLLSYGAEFGDPAYRDRRFLEYVDQLFRGTPPAELPFEGPRRYQLAINLKTASALGLTIPQSLLLRADHVFQ